MSRSIVISQPYYFPWVGLYEQMRLADVFIHYDDVQFIKRHFQDRVQIKTQGGSHWLTVPKINSKSSQLICEVNIDNSKNWKKSHLSFLTQVFDKAPFKGDMLNLVKEVFASEYRYLPEITIASTMAIAEYFGLFTGKEFQLSSTLPVKGHSTKRILDIATHFNAKRYITGLGALNYFDFELSEREGIKVEFLNYQKVVYNQLYGKFIPYVSALDLIANVGHEGIRVICSGSIYWRDFIITDQAKKYLAK